MQPFLLYRFGTSGLESAVYDYCKHSWTGDMDHTSFHSFLFAKCKTLLVAQ